MDIIVWVSKILCIRFSKRKKNTVIEICAILWSFKPSDFGQSPLLVPHFTHSAEAAPVKTTTDPRDHCYRNSEGRAKHQKLCWCACAQCAVAVGLLFDTLRSHSSCLVLPFKSRTINKKNKATHTRTDRTDYFELPSNLTSTGNMRDCCSPDVG